MKSQIIPETPCNATALRKASRRLGQLYDAALASTGLKATQLTILNEILRIGGSAPTLNELADRLVLAPSALGHNLRPLQRDGLVSLEPGPVDRRQRVVLLTTAGRERAAEASAHWAKAQARFEEVYGREEAEQLRMTLAGIAHDTRLSSFG